MEPFSRKFVELKKLAAKVALCAGSSTKESAFFP